jgi:sulfatase maturation enzyme AslB (radical SAM superfamily)
MGNFFCAAPWRGLHINPRGDIKTCCAGDPNMLGNLNDRTIEQVLQGPKLQEIRQSIQRGEPHEYCYNCVQAERYGRSERDWHNNLNPEFDPATAGLTEHHSVLVDIRWNTTCNLSCNYCAEACSSKWAALKHMSVASGAKPYYESVCDYLAQHQTHIREVALVGGEPLLLPENDRLLDVIPRDCIVTLITNLSVELDNNRIFQKLAQRKRVGWSISFDNTNERFEYVRHGASWDLLLHNLDRIQHLMATQGHWGGIHAVYNVYNASRLQEFHEFARSRGLAIHWQSLYQPECLDPSRLGADVMTLARSEIKILLNRNICLPPEHEFFENVLHAQDTNHDLRSDLVKHVHEIEHQYHKNQQGQFARLWPEIEKHIK